MKITHQLANEGHYRREFRILLIGSGGNGSAVLFGRISTMHSLPGAETKASRSR
jgi:shikimate 5-dehydrogenase